MATVVVGQNFHGTIAPAPVDKTPTRQPPRVTPNAAMTRSLLMQVRKRVRFRLQVPRLIESSSRLEFDAPIRVYNISKGHRAVRLTFRIGSNEYWGIEETNWNEAPALADPSFVHKIKGREYALYYSGAHLHMVVLRKDGATYWVVNSILDELSNETMLAIARGPRAASQVGFPVMAESRTIGVFGAGWVGLVTGGCFAELGHEVIVRDVMPERIEALRAGQVPFHEADLPEVLERNRDRIRYTLDAGDLAHADALFICVQTPPTYSGDADLSFVWSALDDLPRVERRQILVMKSTVPVGTGEKVRAALEGRGLANVGYVSNPEFLAEGNAVRDFLNPDRIVIGAFDEEDGVAVEALYGGIEAPIVRTDVASAEMIKLAANAFLMTRISFINEIANVCEAVGADVVEVAKGIGLDHRLGPHFLRAGIGYGGSCFPKDSLALKQLASNSGYHFQLLAAVIEVNELQKRRVVQKLQKHLGKLRGKKIALLGLAFKAGTDDMREAPSLVLASRLLAEGAEVRAWDPVARPGELMKGAVLVDSVLDAVRGADAAVIVTEWDELRGLASKDVHDAMARPAHPRWTEPARPGRDSRAPASPTKASAGRARRSRRCPRPPSASREVSS